MFSCDCMFDCVNFQETGLLSRNISKANMNFEHD